MKSRLDNFALNLSSSGIKFLLSTVIGFVLTPIIIKNVGIEEFGLFRTLQDYIAYLILIEFGLYGALLASFNKIINKDQGNDKLKTFWVAISSYKNIAIICILVGLAFVPFLETLFKVSSKNLYSSYFVLLFGFLSLPLLSFKAYLDASQKGYQINLGLTIQVISNAILVCLSLYLGLGILGLCIALVVSNFLSSFWFYFASDIKFKEVFRERKKSLENFSALKKLKDMRKAMFFTDLAGRVCLFTDNIVIGFMLGAKFVTPFFVTQKLSLIIQTNLQYFSHSSWAGLGEIYHKDSPEALGDSLIDLTKWIGILGVSALVPVATYNEAFISLWTGANTFAGQSVTIVACLNAFFLGIITLWGWCFTATSKMELLVPLNWVQTVVNLVLNIFLTYKYGFVGPILATLICYLFISTSWLGLLINREFKASTFWVHFNWIAPLAYGIGFYFLWTHFRGSVVGLGWFRVIIEMSLQGIFVLGLSFIFVMNNRERRASFQRLMKLLKRN